MTVPETPGDNKHESRMTSSDDEPEIDEEEQRHSRRNSERARQGSRTGVTQHQARNAQSTTLVAARGLVNPSCANYPGNRSYNPSGILMLMKHEVDEERI
jgi:hypothetical protein